jgi:hypothetical protein
MKIKNAIGEILNRIATTKGTAAKVIALQEVETVQLKQVLRLIYDDTIEFLLPDTPPPFKENGLVDLDTMLYREARRLRIFFKGGGYDNLKKERRETLFIQLLEDLHPADAKILSENMLSHTPLKGLTKKTIESAFPTIFTDPLNFK